MLSRLGRVVAARAAQLPTPACARLPAARLISPPIRPPSRWLATPAAGPRLSLLGVPPAPQLLCSGIMGSLAGASRCMAVKTFGELKSYKPTSPGRRFRIIVEKGGLWKGRPEASLISRLRGAHLGGRNNTGRITVRRREGRKHRMQYRIIDFKRTRHERANVERLEYDPHRSAFIALIRYDDGTPSYIIAPKDLSVGDVVESGDGAPFAPGNAMTLRCMPEGMQVHNVELIPGAGGKMARAAGNAAKLQSKDGKYALLKLQSGEIRKVLLDCRATVGVVSNENHQNRQLGKAGASRWEGKRPSVRGVAMNAVDHPMGGGEGRSSGGRPSSSPWGWYTKGLRTRNKKKSSSKLIVRRRNHDKLNLSLKARNW